MKNPYFNDNLDSMVQLIKVRIEQQSAIIFIKYSNKIMGDFE